jgi:hypothetical protein
VSKTWSRKRKVEPQQVELDELRDGGQQHREAGAGVAEDGPEAGAVASPAYLTEYRLRAENRVVPQRLTQIVLLDAALLRPRRSIRAKRSGYSRFTALVTKPVKYAG